MSIIILEVSGISTIILGSILRMDQKEIDAIEQLIRNLNAGLPEKSRNVSFSNVTEYSFSVNPLVDVYYLRGEHMQ